MNEDQKFLLTLGGAITGVIGAFWVALRRGEARLAAEEEWRRQHPRWTDANRWDRD